MPEVTAMGRAELIEQWAAFRDLIVAITMEMEIEQRDNESLPAAVARLRRERDEAIAELAHLRHRDDHLTFAGGVLAGNGAP